MARVVALDVGEVRIGVAVSDSTGFLASPYTTLQVSRSEEETWAAIQQLVSETDAEAVVVGLPISLDGQIHEQGRRVQRFAEGLRPHISVPLTFWDERLSTVEAQRLLTQRYLDEGGRRPRQGGKRRTHSRRRQRGQQIDALAAAVFLQDYLDHLGSKTGEKEQ